MDVSPTMIEQLFREWLETAQYLGMAEVIQDSRLYIDYICSAVSSWKADDPPLPPLLPVLSRIFQRISVDNKTVLVASYFEKVVTAHDLDKPIPPIPTHLYPTINPLVTSTVAPVAVGNRKAIESGENQDRKRKRTAEVSEEEPDGSDDGYDELDDDVGSGKGSDEDQQAGEGYAHVVQVVTKATSTRPAHPAQGLTPAELENNWRLQAGDAILKFTPQRSDPVCDHCIARNLICWTVPGQTACLCCRYERKKSCSNTPERIRIPKEPQQRKVTKPEKPAKSSKPKKPTPPREATATILSGSGRAHSAKKTRLDTTEPEPLTAAPPTAQKKPNVGVVQLLPPIDCLPVSTSVKVKVSRNPKVDPSPAAPVLSPSSPTVPGSFCSEPVTPAISKTPTSKQGQSHSRAGSLSQPAVVNYSVAATPDVFDPLVCPPVSDSEVRHIPPFSGSSLIPRPLTPGLQFDHSTVWNLYSRIGGLEGEVRQVSQDNKHLRDDYVQGAASCKSNASELRKEMKCLKKEEFTNHAFYSERLLELSKDIGMLRKQLAELTANVQLLQQ